MNTKYTYLSQDKHLELSDMGLIATMQYLEFPIVAVNRNPKEHPKVGFVFSKTPELDNAISQYWQGLILVDPKNYWSIVRELKSRIKTS